MALDPLAPLSPSAWEDRKARHLLNRAGFGVPRERIAHLSQLEPARAVAELMNDAGTNTGVPQPEFIMGPVAYQEREAGIRAIADADARRKAQNEAQGQDRQAVQRLKAWWFERMMTSPYPLREKMALFWHGHFATSAQKVRIPYATFHLYSLFNEYATGNFKMLATKTGQSPAMLIYLDNRRNIKGKPNENWARELMELFTMGVGHYTEQDIKESARAFTGWSSAVGGFVYNENQHDHGEKTFFGVTGNLDGWDIIDIIFRQPVTAEFICAKLWKYFASEQIDREAVRAMADTLREHHYEIRPVLERLFLSEAFYSEHVIASQIKSPVQFLLQLARDLELDPVPYPAMARFAAELGQNLFYPPNVKGWDGGRAWINANTLLRRYNLPADLIRASAQQRKLAENGEMMAGDMAMQGRMEPNMRAQLQEYLEEIPARDREELRERLRTAQGEDRRAVIEEILRSRPVDIAVWEARNLVNDLAYRTAGEFADALAARMLVAPLADDQRRVLVQALGAGSPGDPLDGARIRVEDLNATLHLLFSMAEYQLC